MMKTVKFALLALALGLVANQSASAQSVIGPVVNFEDSMYDFEVYAAQDAGDGFYILWEMEDGSTIKWGPHWTYEDAQYRLMRVLFGGWEPDGYVNVTIQEMPIPPTFLLFDTVETRAEAEELAMMLESFGLLTQIERVSVLQFRNYVLR